MSSITLDSSSDASLSLLVLGKSKIMRGDEILFFVTQKYPRGTWYFAISSSCYKPTQRELFKNLLK